MSNHYLLRIVTFMGYPDFVSSSPQRVLEEGTRAVVLPEKVRFFTVRKVFYDDSMRPIYSLPSLVEHKYSSLREIRTKYTPLSPIFDNPILDNDNSLKTWNNE